ncbi:hypothetical protein N7499_011183 [Penicillium canescens]|uniref:Uncharacterized protein n=1 Tax=Penicillium canescens TaxID=5083 RepID=A0AAD6IJN9_PENCN|nr:uncharacterized protein N7446_006441 [Penicillium canescens]KAJ6051805.1 hypothetical protein N7460_002339 [Penicillium canescens]KAJ6062321.1 hypothetical protein N7446_006441 [Penicillium canescens]KAJ6065568.1 hypothetical protein N7444_001221 [Penicillium canescens]KAJ6069296.1 hypothetical protein N7499_011183 [Penicillium canescens]
MLITLEPLASHGSTGRTSDILSSSSISSSYPSCILIRKTSKATISTFQAKDRTDQSLNPEPPRNMYSPTSDSSDTPRTFTSASTTESDLVLGEKAPALEKEVQIAKYIHFYIETHGTSPILPIGIIPLNPNKGFPVVEIPTIKPGGYRWPSSSASMASTAYSPISPLCQSGTHCTSGTTAWLRWQSL